MLISSCWADNILLGWAKFRQLCCPTILHALLLLLASWAIKEAAVLIPQIFLQKLLWSYKNPNFPTFPAKITTATIYKRPWQGRPVLKSNCTHLEEKQDIYRTWRQGSVLKSGGALPAPMLFVLEMLSRLKSFYISEFWGFWIVGFGSCGVFELWFFFSFLSFWVVGFVSFHLTWELLLIEIPTPHLSWKQK